MKNDKHAPDKSGEELFSYYLAGDESAFEELVKLYEHDLALFINSIVGDMYETKHLLIDTFAQLAVGGRRYEGRSTLKTYLFTIGKNLALRYLKMRRREMHLSYDEVFEKLMCESETPDELLQREENKQRLQAAMNDLKPDYRKVMQLLYFEDMSYAEAGQALGKTVKQISDLSYRAKSSLKKKLKSEGFDDVE